MKLAQCTTLIVTLAAVAKPAVSVTHLTMTIRVLDQANLSASNIQKMERFVENTLASIHVDVNWVDCGVSLDICQGKRGPNEFWLRILAQMPPRVNGAGPGPPRAGSPAGPWLPIVEPVQVPPAEPVRLT